MKIDSSFTPSKNIDIIEYTTVELFYDEKMEEFFDRMEIFFTNGGNLYGAETSLIEFDSPFLDEYRNLIIDNTSSGSLEANLVSFPLATLVKVIIPKGIKSVAFKDANGDIGLKLINQTSDEWNKVLSEAFGIAQLNYSIDESMFSRVLTLVDSSSDNSIKDKIEVSTHLDRKESHGNIIALTNIGIAENTMISKLLFNSMMNSKTMEINGSLMVSDSCGKYFIGSVAKETGNEGY